MLFFPHQIITKNLFRINKVYVHLVVQLSIYQQTLPNILIDYNTRIRQHAKKARECWAKFLQILLFVFYKLQLGKDDPRDFVTLDC